MIEAWLPPKTSKPANGNVGIFMERNRAQTVSFMFYYDRVRRTTFPLSNQIITNHNKSVFLSFHIILQIALNDDQDVSR